jgi:hypothetical protein
MESIVAHAESPNSSRSSRSIRTRGITVVAVVTIREGVIQVIEKASERTFMDHVHRAVTENCRCC